MEVDWINVKDRLPELIQEEYWVWNSLVDKSGKAYCENGEFGYYEQGDTFVKFTCSITHWAEIQYPTNKPKE